ncbi:hypothetical protein [Longimicrobium sp.]|uniref:hypothetical protein n=1 Tax=Longimicrobium sp. TaxID=2029185 RepID=UPI002E37ACCC|nr:hypothetical protein [Longimicrobium sp.]HEX6041547.1 hypothetical protein [Longimicrobium sp.]
MAQLSHAGRAAAALLEHREAIARAVTARLFEEMPELLDKYGQRGWDKCLQDMRHTVDHLAPAVELESPAMFVRFAEWCDGVLRARNVPTNELVRCLELMRDDVAGRMPAEQSAAVAKSLEAGLGALRGVPSEAV